MKKLFVSILSVVLAVLCTGCVFTMNQVDDYEQESNKEVSFNPSFPLDVYEIEREFLNSFVVHCSIKELEKCEKQELQHNTSAGYYFIKECSAFKVQQSLIDFVGDKNAITNFLAENDIKDKVQYASLFIAPHTPVTLYVKTDNSNFFITINESLEDEGYVYRLYTQDEFKEKFTLKIGSLTIEGKESDIKTKVYSKSADIPLLATLKEFGAEVKEGSRYSKMKIGGKTYYIDLEKPNLYTPLKKKQNLLYQINGGRTFVYAEDGDIMVDDATLNYILYEMGVKVEIIVDWKTANVSINKRT